MKNLFITFFISILVSSNAFAFISVIDVTDELENKVVTVQNSTDYSLEQMIGKKLNYRGNVNEIISLFSEIAEASAPGYVDIEFEVNKDT